jgi:hypothetical protein
VAGPPFYRILPVANQAQLKTEGLPRRLLLRSRQPRPQGLLRTWRVKNEKTLVKARGGRTSRPQSIGVGIFRVKPFELSPSS